MQLFGGLDILSFVSISVLNWIGRVNRMDSKRKEKVFNNNHQRSRLGGRPKNKWWNFAQTNIKKCKITNWEERSNNRADWEKSFMEGKVRVGLQCHVRRRRRRRMYMRYCSRPALTYSWRKQEAYLCSVFHTHRQDVCGLHWVDLQTVISAGFSRVSSFFLWSSPSRIYRSEYVRVLRSACRIDKDERMNELPECWGRGRCTAGVIGTFIGTENSSLWEAICVWAHFNQ